MTLLVTGSSGLIGSEVVAAFATDGHHVAGIDNNMRASFFGPAGDTRWNQRALCARYPTFTHHEIDIRDRQAVDVLFTQLKPQAVIHCAAQPSHDLAASRVFDDFDTNAVGTLNLLEATRTHSAQAPFVYLSTNKVYGDAPNELELIEQDTRWEYADPLFFNGINEQTRVDQTKHSLFGASKLAADILVQEYGRYFGMNTCCLRGGCLTGPNHSGVELHGFLSFLVKTNLQGNTYRVFGYKGKQVRDNIHAHDVVSFIREFLAAPRVGEVYNIGGGRDNSCSIAEAFTIVERITGKPMRSEYVPTARIGDHICYISDLSKLIKHYPRWSVTIPLEEIFKQIVYAWRNR